MKKIGIGILNCYDKHTYNNCIESLPNVDYVFTCHNLKKVDIKPESNSLLVTNYISYGGMYNIILREFVKKNIDYIFLLKSNIILNDNSIIQDYINTAKNFGTWFLSRGRSTDPYSTIEDNGAKLNLHLYENLYGDLIFMVRSFVKHCGYFNEGYINLQPPDDVNILEVYDYYIKIMNKLNYLPLGFFPDTELSLAKTTITSSINNRPKLQENNTNNITKAYGKFHHFNKISPGQHKTVSRDIAFAKLEKIQQIYSIKNENI